MLNGVPDQLDPVVQLQFAERVLHVVLHGTVGQHQPGGDLLVGHAGGDQRRTWVSRSVSRGAPAPSPAAASRRTSPSPSAASPGVNTPSPPAVRPPASRNPRRAAAFNRYPAPAAL